MNLKTMQLTVLPLIKTLIKGLSTVLIILALGLELGQLYAFVTHHTLPEYLYPLSWFGRFAISAHFVEAGVAAKIRLTRQQPPLQYGIYTFFVGTVGLMELFEHQPEVK